MTLDEYLYESRLTLGEFAYMIGYHPNYLSEVKNGNRKCSKRMAYMIDMITKNRVSIGGHVPSSPKE